VPFEPLEGRDVFCQECYRARRPAAARHEDAHAAAPPAPHAESAAMRDDGNPDAGIVE